MTGRQRVLRALRHEIPDRVPIDYSANPGIDRRLKEHFGLAPADREGLFQALGVDFRRVMARYTGPRLHPESDDPSVRVTPDWGLQVKYIEHESGGYWEPWGAPLKDLDPEIARTYPMPSPDDFDYDAVREACDAWKPYAVNVHAGFEVMNWTARLTGDETMYVGLALGDPALLTLVQRFTEIKQEVLRRTLEAAGDGVDFVWIGEDLGTQRGPRIGMEMFRERIRPIHQRSVDLARAKGLPVMIHSCGSCSWAFEEFIDMGIDAVDTLQPEAADMAPAHLKSAYGDRLAFHGCISTAGPVTWGTPEDVRKDCRETLEIMMPGGGYCFAPTHMLQDNSPTENVLAMYEAAKEYGRY